MTNCSSVVVSRNCKSRVTRALDERLQLMIRDDAIDELLTVATSLVEAKRNVVLNKLISITNGKSEVSAIEDIVNKQYQTLQLTFDEPRIADAVVHGILWPDNKDSVADVIRTACHNQ